MSNYQMYEFSTKKEATLKLSKLQGEGMVGLTVEQKSEKPERWAINWSPWTIDWGAGRKQSASGVVTRENAWDGGAE